MNDQTLIHFILSIAGAAALLIWAVRLVRTGVERGFANQLRLWFRASSDNRVFAAGSGIGAAIFLQSSTAVAVLVSNFVAKGGLRSATGLVILLGADVGSAIVTQLLLVRQPLLIPLCLLIGVTLFLRSDQSSARQIGRILIGLALIFVSLDMIRAATGPIVENQGTQMVMGYFARDLLSAFLVGAGLAWVFHSSVAAVLLFVTLAGQSVLPLPAAAAMVLGANLGGALIAYVLTLSAPHKARRVVTANLVLRGGGAILAALLIAFVPSMLGALGAEPGRQVINLHLIFNILLAIFALPFVNSALSFAGLLVTDRSLLTTGLPATSALDPSALEKPQRALDCAARELLGMGQKIEQMLINVTPLYDTWDAKTAQSIKQQDKVIKQIHLDLKLYLAQLSKTGLDDDMGRRSMDLAATAVSLDAASDAIARTMLGLAKRMNMNDLQFSPKGRKEIGNFSDRVQNNIQLALNVMLNQNPAEARDLIAAKEKVGRVEQKMQRHHLGRLREGLVESIETSNIHQETLRALKQINAAFSVVGYAILAKSGDLLKSRLT